MKLELIESYSSDVKKKILSLSEQFIQSDDFEEKFFALEKIFQDYSEIINLNAFAIQIIKCLYKGDMMRKDLVSSLDTPRTTIYDHLVALQKKKIVRSYERRTGERGRPPVFWKLKNDFERKVFLDSKITLEMF